MAARCWPVGCASPHERPRRDLADLGVTSHGDPTGSRAAALAERWHLLWATDYQPITNPLTGQPAAMVLPEQVLRVRPIGPPTPLGPADHGGDTAAGRHLRS